MADIKKEYFPYPGNTNYYQVTKNAFDIPKPVHTKNYTSKQIDEMINDVISKIHHSTHLVTGSVSFDNLPEANEDNAGVIYNVTDAFTTDGRFIEGAGKKYPAGTNIVIVYDDLDSKFKFDVFAGEIENAPESDIEDIIDDLYKD